MGEIINLNKYRRQRQKQEKEQKSAVNRVKFGRIKSERELTANQAAKDQRDLELKKRAPIPFTPPQSDATSDEDPEPA